MTQIPDLHIDDQPTAPRVERSFSLDRGPGSGPSYRFATGAGSLAFSGLVHLGVLAILAAIPMAQIHHFSSFGQQKVVSIEASFSNPNDVSSVHSEVEPVSFNTERDDPSDQAVALEPIEFKISKQSHEAASESIAPPTMPEQAKKVSMNDVPQADKLQMKRRQFDEPMPNGEITVQVPKPAPSKATPKPPSAAAIPIDQFVGLEESSPMDLSDNRPPDYPPEAIKQRLEGVVLLQIEISTEGTVDSVQVIRSSGHTVLDSAAIAAVSEWEGKPARRWGRAVEAIERLPIRFRL